MPDELEAVVAAAKTGGTIFAYLAKGDRFSFNRTGSPPVYTKLTTSHYGFVSVREKWRCAPRATVYPAPDPAPREVGT
jgi:hypothetical protein